MDRSAVTGRATYAGVLRVAEFRVLFGATVASLGSETLRMLALAVLVFQTTGSALLSGLAYVCGFAPQVVGGATLLAWADRLPARTVLTAWAAIRAMVAAVLASGVLPAPAMLVLTFVSGFGAPIASAASNAILPDVLHGDAYVLGRSLFGMASAGVQMVGFAVGAALLAASSPNRVLWLSAAMFVLAAVVLRAGLDDRPARSSARGRVVATTWRVNRELLRDVRVRRLLFGFWLPMAWVVAGESLAVPYAAQLGDPAAAGGYFAGSAIGMFVGGLVVGRLVPPAWRERLTTTLATVASLSVAALALRPPVVVGMLLIGLAGFGLSYELGLQNRFLATLDALGEERRGQGFGLLGTGMMTAQALTVVSAGALAQNLSASRTMGFVGLAALAATWIELRQRSSSHVDIVRVNPVAAPEQHR